MDLEQADAILVRHRPVGWLLRWFRRASCRECGQRWPCGPTFSARYYKASLPGPIPEMPPIPDEWRADW